MTDTSEQAEEIAITGLINGSRGCCGGNCLDHGFIEDAKELAGERCTTGRPLHWAWIEFFSASPSSQS